MTLRHSHMPCPLGTILLSSDGDALYAIAFHDAPPAVLDETWVPIDSLPVFTAASAQLDAYFAGALRQFDLPLQLIGTPFQRQVWQFLQQIPFAKTSTYGELAAQVGNPQASRAVGLANGQNPLAIVVPCHRVVGASGALTGYAGGLARKAWLLAHEQGRTLPRSTGHDQLALTL